MVAEATGKPLSFFVDEASAPRGGASDDAAARIEAAAERIAEETERLAATVVELRAELASARRRS
jgi:hypothetical protein